MPAACTRCGTLAEEPEVHVEAAFYQEGVLCLGCIHKLGGPEKAVRWLGRLLSEEEEETT